MDALAPAPSDWLVLSRPIALDDLRIAIERLEACESAGQISNDRFERSFVQQWLSAVISLASRRVVDEPAFEDVIARASSLTAKLSGPSARHRFGTIELDIASGGLVDGSVGSVTWASAPLLARRIVADSRMFLRADPCRVIELGCGTGLVGLTAVAVLRAAGRSGTVTLSDFDPAALALATLNAERNGLAVSIARIDWNDPLPSDVQRYDVILASDLNYDVVDPLGAVVAALLAPGGELHLLMPLRARHGAMADRVLALFGRPPWRIVVEEIEEAPSDGEGLGSFRYLRICKA